MEEYGNYTMLDGIDENVPDQFQEQVNKRINNNFNTFPTSSDNNMLDGLTPVGVYDQQYPAQVPTAAPIDNGMGMQQMGNQGGQQMMNQGGQQMMNQGMQQVVNQGGSQQETVTYNPSPYLDNQEKQVQQRQIENSYNELPTTGHTCLDIDMHIKNCSICSRLHDCDKKPYIIAIFILTIICLLLMKKALNL